MRSTGDKPAEDEPELLPPDTPDEQLNAHCLEHHKLVWETAIKAEIAERLQSDADEDMEEGAAEDDDMELSEGEIQE